MKLLKIGLFIATVLFLLFLAFCARGIYVQLQDTPAEIQARQQMQVTCLREQQKKQYDPLCTAPDAH